VSHDFPEVDGGWVLLPESFTWFFQVCPFGAWFKPGLSPATIKLLLSFYEVLREKSSNKHTVVKIVDGI
jgi:hypothetical protein